MSWADALGWNGRARFRRLIDGRPGRGGLLRSGQLDSEAGLSGPVSPIGTNNTDSNSRLCMASAVTGYPTSLAPTARRAATPTSTLALAWSSGGATWRDRLPVTFNGSRPTSRRSALS